MGRKATGTASYVAGKDGSTGHYKVRITCPDGSRPWIHLDPTPKSAKRLAWARERAAAYSERARNEGFVKADSSVRNHTDISTQKAPNVLHDDGTASQAWWRALFAMRDRRGDSSTVDDEGRYRKHIKPIVPGHLSRVTREDCERLRDSLDNKIYNATISWKTAANIWAVWTTACRLAATSKHKSLRVRTDNPCQGIEGPDKGHQRGKTWLWPSEFLQLVECETVPLRWRRIYTLAIYLYVRGSELKALEWDDVDLTHGIVNVHRAMDRSQTVTKSTKSGEARRFSVERELLPLLRAMAKEPDVGSRVIMMPDRKHWAPRLRAHLKRAGVTRSELFANDATRKHITFHDLKATAVTWMAIRGDAALKIMQRAAHRDFQTTQRYMRSAEMVGDVIGQPFPPLPDALFGHADAHADTIEMSSPPTLLSPLGDAISSQISSSALQVRDIIVEPPGIEPGSARPPACLHSRA